MKTLRLLHLLPSQAKGYGDEANLLCLTRRAAAKGIALEIVSEEHPKADSLKGIQMVYMSGKEESVHQSLVQALLPIQEALMEGFQADLVGFFTGAGFRSLGKNYKLKDGTCLEGLGLGAFRTEVGDKRVVGNAIIESDRLKALGMDPRIIGFENHLDYCILADPSEALGRLVLGGGNRGRSKGEGYARRGLIATHLYAGLLPRNPALADLLIGMAAKEELTALKENAFERGARNAYFERFYPKSKESKHA